MGDPELPMTGENMPIKVFIDNQPQNMADVVDKFKIDEDAVIHKDQYMGRSRSRFDKQVDGYDLNISSDLTNTALLAAFLAQDAAREANQPIPEIAVEVQARQRNGQIKSFMCSKCVAKWGIDSPGRTERAKTGLDIKFEKIVPVAL